MGASDCRTWQRHGRDGRDSHIQKTVLSVLKVTLKSGNISSVTRKNASNKTGDTDTVDKIH